MDAQPTFTRTEHLDGKVTLYGGDNRDVLKSLPDNSIDSIVTDPPYALVSIVKRFGGANAAPAQHGTDGAYARASSGFMGKKWDTGEVAFSEVFWAECLRVLKPGGHVVSFSGTRTYHRMAVAIEDAGFEIRDQLAWCYGSGFPKSHDVSKAIDKAAGAERGKTPTVAMADATELGSISKNLRCAVCGKPRASGNPCTCARLENEPATEAAREWQGWGTALKPAWEPICLARKPLIGTVAENVLEHGTGALNIDGCRVESGADHTANCARNNVSGIWREHGSVDGVRTEASPLGRWPANIVHNGSDEVLDAFPTAPGQMADAKTEGECKTRGIYGKMRYGEPTADRRYTNEGSTNFAAKPGIRRNDSGSAARFFYCAKASRKDREEGLELREPETVSDGRAVAADNAYQRGKTERQNIHPTVKPTALMEHLVRLVTPVDGTVLDPFMGSGSTGKACVFEGFKFIGIEREEKYLDIAAARIKWAAGYRELPVAARAQPAIANDNYVDLPLFGAA